MIIRFLCWFNYYNYCIHAVTIHNLATISAITFVSNSLCSYTKIGLYIQIFYLMLISILGYCLWNHVMEGRMEVKVPYTVKPPCKNRLGQLCTSLWKSHTIFIWIEARASISYKWFLTWDLNKSGVYSNPGIYSYCSPVQDIMAGASTSVYEFDSLVSGQHVYESAWIMAPY